MLVFVINKEGKPLMPCKPATARKLLKKGFAEVVKRTPFTIQLNFECENKVEPVVLGLDPGYKHIGLSAVSSNKELYSAEVEPRTDVPKKLTEKRQYRRTRRNRKWYRKPRFLNRTRNKKKGWLPPSIEHKLESHIKAVNNVKSILPVLSITVEAAAFDIQKIKNPNIEGTAYQNGAQKGFWNVREYVLDRDGHICQACGGKSKDRVLNAHHVIHKTNGGTDKPDNLITLCKRCHDDYHRGKITLDVKEHKDFKAETLMSIMRFKLVDKLRELGFAVSVTYGYLTKSARIALNLIKSHINDAFVIAGGNRQMRTESFAGSFTRRNNRAIQLNRKGFKPSVRKQRYKFQPEDLVRYAGKAYIVKGMQNLGRYIKLNGLDKPVITEAVKLIKYGKGLRYV